MRCRAPRSSAKLTPSEFAPPPAVPPRTAGTIYHLHLLFDNSQTPGSSQIFNNHIPLDPVLEGVVGLVKTTPSLYVSHGQLVPYEIIFTTEPGTVIPDLSIVDRFPAGFSYVKGSAQIDGVKVEPTIDGGELRWTDLGTSSGAPPAGAAARGRRRCDRRRVREPRAGVQQPDRRAALRRGHRDGAGGRRSHLLLHRRAGQGLRRRQPQRHPGRRRARPARGPAGDRARAGRDHGSVRPLPHHLRGACRVRTAAATSCSSWTTGLCPAATG